MGPLPVAQHSTAWVGAPSSVISPTMNAASQPGLVRILSVEDLERVPTRRSSALTLKPVGCSPVLRQLPTTRTTLTGSAHTEASPKHRYRRLPTCRAQCRSPTPGPLSPLGAGRARLSETWLPTPINHPWQAVGLTQGHSRTSPATVTPH